MDTVCGIPVIKNTDYAIIGGSISAVSAALFLSEHNYKVTLIVKETYLITDLCSPNFYYLENIKNEGQRYLDTIFDKSIDVLDASYEGCRVLHPDRLKLYAEEICDSNGIEYLYAAVPLDVLDAKSGGKILRICGKFGIAGISCSHVLRLDKCDTFDRYIINVCGSPDISHREAIKVKADNYPEFDVYVRPGAYGKGCVTFDIPIFNEPVDSHDAEYEYDLKSYSFDIFKWIKENIDGFAEIRPGRSGTEGFSSSMRVEDMIERGIDAAQNALYKPKLKKSMRPEAILPQNLKMVSNNPLLDLREFKIFKADGPQLDACVNSDLVVVGGGTSGTMAAIYGARHGADTVLIELSNSCGGTGTIGGVSSYWFGKRFKETSEVDKNVNNVYKELNLEQGNGIWGEHDNFNPDIKSMVLLKMCIDVGVKVIFGMVSFACVVDKNDRYRVRGIVSSDGKKTTAYLGKYVIDATGDGDIAAFAGSDFTYGNSRDMFTYWASLAQYTSPEKYKNNFSSTVVVSDINDYTRFIKSGRRRGNTPFDHGTYVAPRESRHINGLYEVNLKDILSFRNYDDAVYTCFSNYDPKGKVTSDMVYGGVLPPPVSSAIPLRALLPVGTDGDYIKGILIAGKAISCTHNALPGIRMQPDLQHQGAAIGIIASEAVKQDDDVLKMDIKPVRKKIFDDTGDDLKVTEQENLTEGQTASMVNGEERLDWVDLPFTEEVRCMPISIRVMVADSDKILPYLQSEFMNEKNSPRKSHLARFILWHGSDKASEFILDEIYGELSSQSGLPERYGSTLCAQLLPDHGVMPEIVYKLNLLAWSKRHDIYKPFEEVLRRLLCTNRDYSDIRKGIYHYIESFSYVAERVCLKEFIPMLKTILKFPEIKSAVSSGNMGDDIMQERLVILAFSTMRALARCGDIEGYEGLIGLLNNNCASVAMSACMELQALTGNNTGINIDKWQRIIHSGEACFSPHPIKTKIW